jgi:hypothetical protein
MQTRPISIFPDGSVGFRRHRRLDVQLAAEAEVSQGRHFAWLVELSPRGARLQLALMLRSGDTLKLRRNGVTVCGSVSWTDGVTAGVQFEEQIHEDAFLQLRRASAVTKTVRG